SIYLFLFFSSRWNLRFICLYFKPPDYLPTCILYKIAVFIQLRLRNGEEIIVLPEYTRFEHRSPVECGRISVYIQSPECAVVRLLRDLPAAGIKVAQVFECQLYLPFMADGLTYRSLTGGHRQR